MFSNSKNRFRPFTQQMKYRLQRVILPLFVACLALTLPADTAIAEEDEPVRFRAQGLPNINATGAVADAQRTVLQRFLRENPDIEIEPFIMPAIEGMGMDSTILMAIAAGVAPQAIYVNFRQSSTYIENGFLLPLEILLARLLSDNEEVRQTDAYGNWLEDPTDDEIAHALEKIRERVPEPSWPVVYRPDESSDDPTKHVWTLPTSNQVRALMYRRDLFFEAGLDPDSPPRDWDELLENARLLTNPERRQYGTFIQIGPNTAWAIYSFLVSTGARAVEQDPETGQWEAAYGTREAAEAVRFVWDLVRGPFERNGTIIRGVNYAGSDGRILWERGQIGMTFGSLEEEMIANINPQLVGIAPAPASPAGIQAAEINARMMGVFAQSTPEQQLAVMRYLWFITGEDAQRIRTRVMVEGGMGQFVNPDLLEKFGYDRLLRLVSPEWRETFEVAMEQGVPEPYGSNTQNIYRHMSEPINAAFELPLNEMSYEDSIALVESMLVESAQRVNVRVIGNIPPEVMQNRRIVGSLMLLLVLVSFSWTMIHVWRHFTKVEVPMRAANRNRLILMGSGLVFPALALVVLWEYLPLLGGLGISMMDFQIVKSSSLVFVDNFANVMFDERFWMGMLRTLYFVALTIGLGFWPPILLAILLQEVPTDTAKYIYRTIYYLPAVISGVVVMFLWRQLYDPSEFGVLNQIIMSLNHLGPIGGTLIKWGLVGFWLSLIFFMFYVPWKLEEMSGGVKLGLVLFGLLLVGATLYPLYEAFRGPDAMQLEALGLDPSEAGGMGAVMQLLSGLVGAFNIEPLRWIESPELAMLCIVIPSIWASSGPGCLLYLAALKTVPEELYEAADIDGATNLHKIFYIVLPRLKFLIVIQFIAAVVAAFKGGTESIMIMTGGGPNNATTIAALEIFFRAFIELDFGMATAMAWIVGALLIGFTAIQLKMLSRAEFKAGGNN